MTPFNDFLTRDTLFLQRLFSYAPSPHRRSSSFVHLMLVCRDRIRHQMIVIHETRIKLSFSGCCDYEQESVTHAMNPHCYLKGLALLYYYVLLLFTSWSNTIHHGFCSLHIFYDIISSCLRAKEYSMEWNSAKLSQEGIELGGCERVGEPLLVLHNKLLSYLFTFCMPRHPAWTISCKMRI